jgi:hypothetical protein
MGKSVTSMGKSVTSMSNGTGVYSWGYSVFVGVDNTWWAYNLLDDGFALDWGWDWYVVWSINMDWGWYFNDVGYVLEYFVWDIVWLLN